MKKNINKVSGHISYLNTKDEYISFLKEKQKESLYLCNVELISTNLNHNEAINYITTHNLDNCLLLISYLHDNKIKYLASWKFEPKIKTTKEQLIKEFNEKPKTLLNFLNYKNKIH